MEKISAIIIAFNEEKNIERCLQSLEWADEIVIIDAFSTDRTVALSKKYTARIIQHTWEGFAKQKIFATSQARNDWIFSIDADEEVSDQLKYEIIRIKQSGAAAQAYRMSRKMYYLGKWITHGSWYPDYKVRLFNRQHGHWEGVDIHEYWQFEGRCEKLKGDILHYSYENITDHLSKINTLTSKAAAEMVKKGERYSFWKLSVASFLKFIKSYFIQAGFRDGFVGLIIAVLGSYYVFLKYLKLWELRHSASK
jgi:glycosyltransferase involved in cell wall biosynthesis